MLVQQFDVLLLNDKELIKCIKLKHINFRRKRTSFYVSKFLHRGLVYVKLL